MRNSLSGIVPTYRVLKPFSIPGTSTQGGFVLVSMPAGTQIESKYTENFFPNSTFASLSTILHTKYDLNFGRFFDFILSWS